MTESKKSTFSDYRKMVPKLDRVIHDMEDLNNLQMVNLMMMTIFQN